MAIGLRSSLESAEKIKLALSEKKHKESRVDEKESDKDGKKTGEIDTLKLGITEDLGVVSKKTLIEGITRPRLTEIFTLIGMEIKRAGFAGLLPAGLVISGGAADTTLLAQVGKEVLKMPVRVAEPKGVSGLIDEISEPAYSNSVGLLFFGEKISVPTSRISLPLSRGRNLVGFVKKLTTWLRGLLP